MKIVVTPQELISTATRIETLAGEYAQLYTALFSDVNALQTAWQGKDNQAFTNQIEGFRNDFENMKALMDEYAAFLKNAATNYASTQDSVTEAAGRLSVGK